MRSKLKKLVGQIRTLFAYFSIPALGAVAPLFVIPAISAQFGATAWASVAIAQSVGAAASVIAELGWGVVGPQRVAQVTQSRRFLIYRSALSSKLVTTLALAPLAGVVTYVIAPEYQLEVALLATATALGALSPGWFFIGSGKPSLILISESLPRVILNLLAAIAITLGLPLVAYSWSMLALPLFTLIFSFSILGRRYIPGTRDFRRVGTTIRSQSVIAAGRAISVVYTTLPIAIVGVVAPSVVPVFAASERLMRMSLSILGGVPSRLQSWIGSAPNAEGRLQRSKKSIYYNALLGLVCGLGFALLAPWVSSILFVGTIQIPFSVSFTSGALLWIICTSKGVGLSLVAARRANSITPAIFWAALVGTLSIVPLTLALGAPGAILGELAAEITGVAIQAVILWRFFRSRNH